MAPLLRELPSTITLSHGSHDSFSEGCCVMEAVAYVAGEPHSDHPACACPVISTFLRSWNDGLPSDEDRDRLLKPLIPLLIDTKANAATELARVMLVVDWLCREFTPTWLESVPSLAEHAAILRAAKPVQSWDDLNLMLDPLRAAKKSSAAARDAASAAARAAARDAAWAAAWAAAWDAAWAAAWDAASAAAWDALEPTTKKLQASAVELIKRMIAVR